MLIMDEPTSALPADDAGRLFERIEALRNRGCCILYISHRMDELERLADRVTVLRDGRVVASEPAEAMSPDKLVNLMVGRDVHAVERHPPGEAESRVVIAARGVTAASQGARLRGVDLTVRRGEIVGVVGLNGSGASLLPRALFGAVPVDGDILIADQPVVPTPARCLAAGAVMLSGDRHETIIGAASVLDNATLSSLRRFSGPGTWLRGRVRAAAADATLDRMRAVHPGLEAPVSQLSGGNKQKVALARALLTEPRVLLLDEPTRGIDAAAKQDVHAALLELAAEGVGVLLYSTDLDELVALADRVLVVVDGDIRRVVEGAELTRSTLLATAIGGRA